MTELERAWREAYSIENREGWEAEDRDIEYIGQIQNGARIYLFYRDSEGDYWYGVKIQTPQGVIEEANLFRKRR